MADIAPFRALRYNTRLVPDLGQVIIPPYDVIDREEQKRFHEQHPFNMIRLDLGEALPGDNERENAHSRAAAYLRDWRERGVLIRDSEPCLYPYELDYQVGGEKRTRKGFFALLRLEELGGGCVRPHEKTFQDVKDERLGLMKVCSAQLSSIFVLYGDPEGRLDEIVGSEAHRDFCASFSDRQGMTHRLFRMTDLDRVRKVKDFLRDKEIFIADGHHRYETALAYRDWMRARHPNASSQAPFNYVMVYLSSMDDPGLTILPTHRLLLRVDPACGDRLLESVEPYFQVRSYELTDAGIGRWRQALAEAAARKEPAVGLAVQGHAKCYLLQGVPGALRDFLARKGFPQVLQDLDVMVVDHLLLRGHLALGEDVLHDPRNIRFSHDAQAALDEVRNGRVALAFILNPTRMEQVRAVASSGCTMPHKATYFYPKVGSGLLIHPIDPGEVVE
ncbi:Uncharacterized conserved protein, DUF1015 family [Desulfacinum hydrothermale DSM 13146]|uniref:Uncharacterized conserved protein, DUF1015 family n=1 Tax=Desulfacinum hydrothermale DSM 13146 TaxID=1121390 RepID=A0A1W1X6H7_9BACT|nr:DUF1015 domain-containing protein [Desulfacinum hydrothermale]SMC19569.1 Uncharacterized conserved protein, DUF1015 family [Desulfacinum hydrothermale DSM 13146]